MLSDNSDGFSVAGIIIGAVCVLAVISTIVYGAISPKLARRNSREATTAEYEISNISFIMPERIEIEVGSDKTSTIAVRSSGIVDPTEIVFVSTSPQVAAVRYVGSVSSYIGFRVVGLSPGSTEISAKSADGRITTRSVTVIVRPAQTTLAKTPTDIPLTPTDETTTRTKSTRPHTTEPTKPHTTKQKKPTTEIQSSTGTVTARTETSTGKKLPESKIYTVTSSATKTDE